MSGSVEQFLHMPRGRQIYDINGPVVQRWQDHEVKQSVHCCFIPPHIHEKLNPPNDPDRWKRADHKHTVELRQRRIQIFNTAPSLNDPMEVGSGDKELFKIYDAQFRSTIHGKEMTEEQIDKEPAALRAQNWAQVSFLFYKTVLGRNSIDDKGCSIESVIHYRRKYDNAFWDGEKILYGAGDGKTFDDFTVDPDVGGHELAHGVTGNKLIYNGQSGALNEHMSDVIGSCVKQWYLKQSVSDADWLIGDKVLIGPGALRSMKAPGTAYKARDYPALGSDPQPATMDGFVHTKSDDGGVHTNSGIPNKAFYLVSIYIGGNSWEKAGKIWYETINQGGLSPNAIFSDFAKATIATAEKIYKRNSVEYNAVMKGWREVKVLV